MSTLLPRVEISPAVRTIIFDPPLSDCELERLCLKSDARIERRKDGVLLMNPPTGMETGDANSEISYQLRTWWRASGSKGRTFDSSTGFFLPNGEMTSPDASFALPGQIAALSPKERGRMARFCPAFVIELVSPSDTLADAERKMSDTWLANGALLGWLVVPKKRQVIVYEAGKAPRVESGPELLGTGPVEGFILDLRPVWDCYSSS
jgi:Uma2 family endonuclease